MNEVINKENKKNKRTFYKTHYFFIGCTLLVSGVLSYTNNHILLGIGLVSIAVFLPIFYTMDVI